MSKIALCLSGLPRFYKRSTLAWIDFIQKYNCDVFIHTWGNDDTKKELFNYYTPKLLELESPKSFDISLYKDRIWPHRSSPTNVISSWYSINASLNLCEKYYNHTEEDYDIICRSRFDWWCEEINLNISSNLTVPDDPGLSGHHFNFNGKNYLAFNDQFGYGNKFVMKEYANTFNKIPDLYQRRVDFCSELFLTANMIDTSIKIDFQKMHYTILRE